jgi:hypothetical protein
MTSFTLTSCSARGIDATRRLSFKIVLVKLDGGCVIVQLPGCHGGPLVQFLGARHLVKLASVVVHARLFIGSVAAADVHLKRRAHLHVGAVNDKLVVLTLYSGKIRPLDSGNLDGSRLVTGIPAVLCVRGAYDVDVGVGVVVWLELRGINPYEAGEGEVVRDGQILEHDVAALEGIVKATPLGRVYERGHQGFV